jgi:hypothetical protein
MEKNARAGLCDKWGTSVKTKRDQALEGISRAFSFVCGFEKEIIA